MSRMQNVLAAVAIALGPTLGGCGLYVPQPHEVYENQSNDTLFQNVILNNVKCELHKGVQATLDQLNNPENPRVSWIKDWGAKAALAFTVDETGSVNPSVSFTPPPPFSLFFDIGASAHATREEDMDVTYAFRDLLNEGRIGRCDHENGILIQSDLDIGKFIEKHVYLLTIPGTLPSNIKAIANDWQYKVTFVASYNADLNPSWTFKHVSVNSSGKLLGASRSKTTNLIITFSPISSRATAGNPAQLNAEGLLVHDAAKIGQATASANISSSR
jgi:hypothetical protein